MTDAQESNTDSRIQNGAGDDLISPVKYSMDSGEGNPDTNSFIEKAETGKRKMTWSETFKKVKEDSLYRQRLVHTCIIVWSFAGLGWAVGLNGPSLPDLMQIIDEDLDTSSWMFTAGSFGYLSGSLLGGILYDRLNKVVLLAICTLGMGLATLVTPYCSLLPAMLFIKFTGGFFCGGLDTGGNADIIHVWGIESDSYMQAIHFGFSFGGILSPFATEPFLAKKITVCKNMDIENATSSVPFSQNSTDSENGNTFHENNQTSLRCEEVYEKTNVHFAYLIASVIMLTSTAGFVYLYLKIRRNKKARRPSHIDIDAKNSDKFKKRKSMTLCVKILALIMLALLMALYCVAEDCFASFLMTFALTHLKWKKSIGAFATALFWSSFGVGRFAGIFIVSCFNNTTLLTVYLCWLTAGYVGFLLSSFFLVYPLIWVCIASLGFSMSVIFPAIFSWTAEHLIHVSGKISALFLTASSLAGMTFPLLIGNLMEHFHPMWYSYTLVTVAASCVAIYFCLRILVKYCMKVKTETKENQNNTEGTEMTLIPKS